MKVLHSVTDYIIYIFEITHGNKASRYKYHLLQHFIHQFIILFRIFQVIHAIWFLQSGYDVQSYKNINPLLYVFLIMIHYKNPHLTWSVIKIFICFIYLNYYAWFTIQQISPKSLVDAYFTTFFRKMTFKQMLLYDTNQMCIQSSPYITTETLRKDLNFSIMASYFTEYYNKICRK